MFKITSSLSGIITADPFTLKSWVRDYKEKVRLKSMGVSVHVPGGSPFSESSPCSGPEKLSIPSTSSNSTVVPNSTSSVKPRQYVTEGKDDYIKYNTKETFVFYVESLSESLSQFFFDVINRCNERVYGQLKKHASQPKLSWSLIECLAQVVRRWNTLTMKNLPLAVHDNIRQIIKVVKKFKTAQEELTKSDLTTFFTCSDTVVRQFSELYDDLFDKIMGRIEMLREEWEMKSISRAASDVECEEFDAQPVEVALQNIYSSMRLDCETLRAKVEMETDKTRLKEALQAFYLKVTNILQIIESLLEENYLHVDSDCILEFMKHTSLFKDEFGHLSAYEFSKEDVLSLVTESNGKKVKAIFDKIRKVQSNVMDALTDLDSDMDEMDYE